MLNPIEKFKFAILHMKRPETSHISDSDSYSGVDLGP